MKNVFMALVLVVLVLVAQALGFTYGDGE